jgi:hypothetical protein
MSVARIRPVLLAAAVAAALAGVPVHPAAASSLVTTATRAGRGLQDLTTLTISVPARADLGTAAAGAMEISGNLGDVTVTASGTGSWTASVMATDFSNGVSTIPAANIFYSTPVATTTGNVLLGTPKSAALSSSVSQTVQTAVAVAGDTTVTWDPTLTVTLPPSLTKGTYTAIITHSVA